MINEAMWQLEEKRSSHSYLQNLPKTQTPSAATIVTSHAMPPQAKVSDATVEGMQFWVLGQVNSQPLIRFHEQNPLVEREFGKISLNDKQKIQEKLRVLQKKYWKIRVEFGSPRATSGSPHILTLQINKSPTNIYPPISKREPVPTMSAAISVPTKPTIPTTTAPTIVSTTSTSANTAVSAPVISSAQTSNEEKIRQAIEAIKAKCNEKLSPNNLEDQNNCGGVTCEFTCLQAKIKGSWVVVSADKQSTEITVEHKIKGSNFDEGLLGLLNDFLKEKEGVYLRVKLVLGRGKSEGAPEFEHRINLTQ